ncbi:type II secretion system F family protein [Streptomyces sp. JJ38]|uniref:type II secretion system F family protein n=1 Tax=Streptomyces sp. JJ38 TaxID=2738128 RepID=UPI001C58D77F|nr:type II secretion system F family protein [Streptomyces sp. JJ38]MBW1597995.1 hypothetical protein [Streptomyces sp. JJ38]
MTPPGGAPDTVYAALALAGAAVWLAGGRGAGDRRPRLLLAGDGTASPGSPSPTAARAAARLRGAAARCGRHWLCLPAGALLGLLGASPLPFLAGVAAVPLVGRALRARERRRAAHRREAAVIELCTALSAELRAGRQPDAALPEAAEAGRAALGEFRASVLAAARFGGDVPSALRRASGRPGAEGLAGVAACWQVAVDGGAGLADGLDRVADALRAERDQREELDAQLAGPRTTAVALALLPAFGLLLGSAMGAEPLRFLLHSPAGWGVLAGAVLLEAAGLAWTRRIVRAAGTRPSRAALPAAGPVPVEGR